MPKRDETKYNIEVVGEPIEVRNIRKLILDSFKDLEFIEEGHKYFLKGQELCSVSSVAQRFEEEFDAIEKSVSYALKHGNTPEYWQDQWKFTNLKATVTGTQVHSFAESCAWIHMGHPENITEDNKYKYIADKNWLIPTRHKEQAVLNFWRDFPDNMWVVLPETKVFNSSKYKERYGGTFDLLVYYKHPTDDSKSGLVIMDWKTNADIYKEYNQTHNKMLYYPFNHLYSEPKSIYTIQLGCYQIPLEEIGLKILGRRIIWLKDDESYEIIPLDDVTDKVKLVLN